jgi:predicted  nucleic acid-binding Zn-ribbon protein
MLRKIFKSEVLLSITIPIIISLGAYFISVDRVQAVNQAEITTIKEQVRDNSQKINDHTVSDAKESGELLSEIRSVNTKVDMIYSDLQELKKRK